MILLLGTDKLDETRPVHRPHEQGSMPAKAAEVQQLFDDKAATWSTKYANGGALSGRLTRFRRGLETLIPAPASALDLGCGTGDLAREFSQHGYEVFAADVAPRMLQRARELSAGLSITWVQLQAGWTSLPFSDGRLDAVVASSVLEYLDDPAVALRECSRILRPDGILLCTVPNPLHPVRWVEALGTIWIRNVRDRAYQAGSGRVRRYVDYLRLSRNRFSLAKWNAIAREARLQPISLGRRSGITPNPLALLGFRKGL